MYQFIESHETLINVLKAPENVEVLQKLARCYNQYYQAEKNLRSFLTKKTYKMVENEWTKEKLEQNRDREASNCMRWIFALNDGADFLRKIRKTDFADCVNEMFYFITTEMPKHAAVNAQ